LHFVLISERGGNAFEVVIIPKLKRLPSMWQPTAMNWVINSWQTLFLSNEITKSMTLNQCSCLGSTVVWEIFGKSLNQSLLMLSRRTNSRGKVYTYL